MICYRVVRFKHMVVESYRTTSRDALTRQKELDKQGYTVKMTHIGKVHTLKGLIPITNVAIFLKDKQKYDAPEISNELFVITAKEL